MPARNSYRTLQLVYGLLEAMAIPLKRAFLRGIIPRQGPSHKGATFDVFCGQETTRGLCDYIRYSGEILCQGDAYSLAQVCMA